MMKIASFDMPCLHKKMTKNEENLMFFAILWFSMLLPDY